MVVELNSPSQIQGRLDKLSTRSMVLAVGATSVALLGGLLALNGYAESAHAFNWTQWYLGFPFSSGFHLPPGIPGYYESYQAADQFTNGALQTAIGSGIVGLTAGFGIGDGLRIRTEKQFLRRQLQLLQ